MSEVDDHDFCRHVNREGKSERTVESLRIELECVILVGIVVCITADSSKSKLVNQRESKASNSTGEVSWLEHMADFEGCGEDVVGSKAWRWGGRR